MSDNQKLLMNKFIIFSVLLFLIILISGRTVAEDFWAESMSGKIE